MHTLDPLINDVVKPEFFKDETRFPPNKSSTIFAIGPTNTGTSWHYHGDAWFALVHGGKHFMLLPNGMLRVAAAIFDV
jgi:hypothetical protein